MITTINYVFLIIVIVLGCVIHNLVKMNSKIGDLKKDLCNVREDITYRENKIDDRIYKVCDRLSAIEGGKHWFVVRYTKVELDEETI